MIILNDLCFQKKQGLIYDRIIFQILTILGLLMSLVFGKILHIILFGISLSISSIFILYYSKTEGWNNLLSFLRGETGQCFPANREFLYYLVSFFIVFGAGIAGFSIFLFFGRSTNASFESVTIETVIEQLFVVSVLESYFLISFLIVPTKKGYQIIQSFIAITVIFFFAVLHNNVDFFISAFIFGSATVIAAWKFRYWTSIVLAHMVLNVFIAPFFIIEISGLAFRNFII